MDGNRTRPWLAGFALLCSLAAAGAAGAATHEEIQADIDSGRLLRARDAATSLTAADASDCRAWYLLGETETRLTHVPQAVQAFTKGLEACPDDKDILKSLGRLYDEVEAYEDAVRVLSHLWSLDTSDPEVGSRLGAAAYRAGKCMEGKKAYETLLTTYPDRLTDRVAYALLLTRTCKDFAAAEEQYRMILGKDPSNAEANCGLAFMLSDAGRVDDAVAAAESGVGAAGTNAGCLYAAWGRALEVGGDSLMARGQVTEARALYEKAVTPLEQGMSDPIFGNYCKTILAGVRYKESPMEVLKP